MKKIIIFGVVFFILLLGVGIFTFFEFQKNIVKKEITQKQQIEEEQELDPLSQLFENNLQQQEKINPSKASLTEGGPEKNLYYSVEGEVLIKINTCMADPSLKESANLGVVYTDLDLKGFEILLAKKFQNCTPEEKTLYFQKGSSFVSTSCNQGITNFLSRLSVSLKPLATASTQNSISWRWDKNAQKHTFYPIPGEEKFWYCYLKTNEGLFRDLFKTGYDTENGQGKNTLYYVKKNETSSLYGNYPESAWKIISDQFSDIPMNTSEKEFLLSKGILLIGNEPLRIYINGNPIYGTTENILDGLYKNQENGLCVLSNRNFKSAYHIPVVNCTDVKTQQVYTLQTIRENPLLYSTTFTQSGELSGMAFNPTIGYIKIKGIIEGSANTYGVIMPANLSSGNLSGYAWNPTIGYINFCKDVATCVSYNATTKEFSGKAYNETIGEISMNGKATDIAQTPYKVVLDTTKVKILGYGWNPVIGYIHFSQE